MHMSNTAYAVAKTRRPVRLRRPNTEGHGRRPPRLPSASPKLKPGPRYESW